MFGFWMSCLGISAALPDQASVFFVSSFGCSPGALPEWMKGTGQRLVDELPVFIPFDLKVWCKNFF